MLTAHLPEGCRPLAIPTTFRPFIISVSPDNRLGSKADAIMLWYWVRKKSSLKRGTLQVRLSNCGFCDHRSPHFHACAAPRRCDEVSGQRTAAMVQWRKVCRGTPTDEYISGTVEEIKRHVGAGKTAKVYFSDVPVAPSKLDHKQYEALQQFKEECRSGGLYATYTDLVGFKSAIQQHLAIELNQPRYLWLPEPAPPATRSAEPLTPEEKRLLIGASAYEGLITTLSGAEGAIIHAGREAISDGTVRQTAIWRGAIQDLKTRGFLEPIGSQQGNYRLTASGFRGADESRAEEEEQKQLEINLNVDGTPTSQKLEIKASTPIRLRQLEYLTTAGVCFASENLDAEGVICRRSGTDPHWSS